MTLYVWYYGGDVGLGLYKVRILVDIYVAAWVNSGKDIKGNYNWESKVKWSRYRPGVAQMVGRGIALLFH